MSDLRQEDELHYNKETGTQDSDFKDLRFDLDYWASLVYNMNLFERLSIHLPTDLPPSKLEVYMTIITA